MMFTARMIHLSAVVLDTDMEPVTKKILEQGVLDFVSIKELDIPRDSRVEAVVPRVSEARLKEIRHRIESLLRSVNLHPGEDKDLRIEDFSPVDLDATEEMLTELNGRIQEKRNEQRELQQEILKLEDIRRQLDLFQDLGQGIRSGSGYSFLSIQAGYLLAQNAGQFEESIQQFPSVFLRTGNEDKPVYLLISLKRDEPKIQNILSAVGWKDVEYPEEIKESKDDVVSHVDEKLERLRKSQEGVAGEVTDIVTGNRDELGDIWKRCVINELYYKIQTKFGRTARTVLFSGWLPREKKEKLEEEIYSVTEGAAYLEWKEPEAAVRGEGVSEAPVQMHNPRFLKPFQALVRNYAVPEYGTIDPTPFVAVSYLTMFGLMFGDVGHGLVILLIGVVGWLLRKKRNKGTTLFQLMTWCGGAAAVTGVLYGSYFGYTWFDPLWFDFHGIIAGHPRTGSFTDIYDVLKITIYFGIGIIGFGLILNWINSVRKRRWFTLLFGKAGLIGGWIYGAGIYTALYYVQHSYKELPQGRLLLYLVAVPVLLLFLKSPLEYVMHRARGEGKPFSPFTVMDFFMEWIVEILEVFSGYLANTLSFMRVAGLGIAHVSLMIAFFSIAEMVSPGGGITLPGVIILVLGNALVIVLEGLSAGIQALRLNYYEFFTKYFTGSGRAYRPISLKSSME